MPSNTFTEEERQAQREADRQRAKDAVEALRLRGHGGTPRDWSFGPLSDPHFRCGRSVERGKVWRLQRKP